MTVVVEERPDGTFRVRVKRKGLDGKWHVANEVGGFTSEREARAEAKKAKALLRTGKLGTSTVTPAVSQMLDAYEKRLLAKGAPGAYHVELARRHLAAILDVEAGHLTFDGLQNLVDNLEGARVGAWAIKRAFSILKTALTPVRRADNPVKGLKLPRPSRKKVRTLSIAEAIALLPHMNPGFRDFFALDLLTGARPSELASADCGDIDLGARQWTVQRSFTRAEPKDGDQRVVPLSHEAVLIFKRLIKAAQREPSEWSDVYEGRYAPIFPPLVRNQARNANLAVIIQRAARAAVDAGDAPTLAIGWDLKCRWCKNVARVAKKPAGDVKCAQCRRLLWCVPVSQRVIWYALRHTTVSLLDEAGVKTNVIAEIVGHSSAAFTEATYVHRSPQKMRAAIEHVSLRKRVSK